MIKVSFSLLLFNRFQYPSNSLYELRPCDGHSSDNQTWFLIPRPKFCSRLHLRRVKDFALRGKRGLASNVSRFRTHFPFTFRIATFEWRGKGTGAAVRQGTVQKDLFRADLDRVAKLLGLRSGQILGEGTAHGDGGHDDCIL